MRRNPEIRFILHPSAFIPLHHCDGAIQYVTGHVARPRFQVEEEVVPCPSLPPTVVQVVPAFCSTLMVAGQTARWP